MQKKFTSSASPLRRMTERKETDMTQKFQTKPVVIEAWRFTQGNYEDEWPEFIGEAKYYEERLSFSQTYSGRITGASIRTLGGTRQVKPGDWIIRDTQGELHSYDHKAFEALYEPVQSVSAGSQTQFV